MHRVASQLLKSIPETIVDVQTKKQRLNKNCVTKMDESTAGNIAQTFSPKKPKPRASRACVNCNYRKIRCDAALSGCPCTNCRHDGHVCTLYERKRARARHLVTQRPSNVLVTNLKRKNNEEVNNTASRKSILTHVQLPEYVEQPLCQLAPEDLKYLCCKGAMTVPNRSVALEIFEIFLNYVYPLMPVLELDPFFCALSADLSREKVNLFVLKCIISASIQFMPQELLFSIGYENLEPAQKECAQQAKLLYDFEVTNDPHAILQGSIIMTFWDRCSKDSTQCRYWADLSLSWAMRMGLNRNCLTTTCGNSNSQALSRRLWWTVYLRDSLTAMWSRLPPSISPEDFDVRCLEMKDFDLAAKTNGSLRHIKSYQLTFNLEFRERLAATFIDICSLAILLARVLRLRFSARSQNINITSNTSGYMNLSEEAQCEIVLQEWLYSRAAVYSRRTMTQQGNQGDKTLHSPLRKQALFVHLLYHVTIQSMYVSQGTAWGLPGNALAKAHEVAKGIAEILAIISQAEDLTQTFPATVLIGLSDTVVVHTQSTKSLQEHIRLEGLEGLRFCVKHLADLKTPK